MAMKHGALRHIISGGESSETAITTRAEGARPISTGAADLVIGGTVEDEEGDLQSPLSARAGRRPFSEEQLGTIEEGVRLILRGLGEDLDREGIRNTPARVARMYADLCSGHTFNATTFPNTQGYSEMVLVRGIQFYSLCEHHLMPFFGQVTVAYIPGDRILGLSKLGRIVEEYARRLQLQEQFTEQIAQCLEDTLSPAGIGVFVAAEHLCMSARGVEKPGHQTHTFSLHGLLKTDPHRTEFLRQCECYRS